MKRISSLDYLRGIAILVVVIFHGVIFTSFNDTGDAAASTGFTLKIITLPYILLGSWASLFAFISGIASTYSMQKQQSAQKLKYGKKFQASIIRTIILLTLHFVYVSFFIHPYENIAGEAQLSLVTGTLQEQQLILPKLSNLFFNNALSMLAFSDLFVTVFWMMLWKNRQTKLKQNFIIMNIFATFFLLFSPFLQEMLTPTMISDYNEGKYFRSMLLTWLIGTKHPIFPFVGFALYGSAFGMLIEKKVEYKKIFIYGFVLGAIYLLLGIFSAVAAGEFNFDRPVQHISLTSINLGEMVWLFVCVYYLFDVGSEGKKQINNRHTTSVRRWGLISLTVFMFECPVAAFFALLWNLIIPGITENIFFVIVIWIPMLALLWWNVLFRWEKRNFIFSLEWCMGYIFTPNKAEAKNLDILNIQDAIYTPGGVDRQRKLLPGIGIEISKKEHTTK